MLNKPGIENIENISLPLNWSRHLAPSGHYYYYNSVTQQSTYEKPKPDPETQLNNEIKKQSNDSSSQIKRKRKTSTKKKRNKDKPRFKIDLSFEPWALVFLKSGRHFFHNKSTKESFWTPPSQKVLDSVDEIDIDTIIITLAKARGLKKNRNKEKTEAIVSNHRIVILEENEETEYHVEPVEETHNNDTMIEETLNLLNDEAPKEENQTNSADENVVGTENDNPITTHMKDDDEIDLADLDLSSDDEELTPQQKESIFIAMLVDNKINPDSNWDNEYEKLLEDERYLIYDSSKQRRKIYDQWAKEFINQTSINSSVNDSNKQSIQTSILNPDQDQDQDREEVSSTSDITLVKTKNPKVEFINFIKTHFKSKRFYIDFKRKYRKEPNFANSKLTDREKEKIFRLFHSEMKSSQEERIVNLKQFIMKSKILKKITTEWLQNNHETIINTKIDDNQIQELFSDFINILPESVISDVKLYVVDDDIRNVILKQYLTSTIKQ